MQTVIVIPARLASTRLHHKPLAMLGDVPLVVRTARRAQACRLADQVVVATDDAAVMDACLSLVVNAVMTKKSHPSGTDRVWEVAQKLGAQCIINLQGDEPFIEPADLDQLIAGLRQPGAQMVTLRRPIVTLAEYQDPNVVKVVCDDGGRALLFSRASIPRRRPQASDAHAEQVSPALPRNLAHAHVGVYGYTFEALSRFCAAPVHPLEDLEKLEQLRALAMGLRIDVFFATTRARGIDTPDDLAWARQHAQAL